MTAAEAEHPWGHGDQEDDLGGGRGQGLNRQAETRAADHRVTSAAALRKAPCRSHSDGSSSAAPAPSAMAIACSSAEGAALDATGTRGPTRRGNWARPPPHPSP